MLIQATSQTERSDAHRRRSQPVLERWGGLTARLAIDNATRRDAYALRYQSFLAANFIDPSENEMFSDAYDEKLNCTTVVLYDDERPVASVRVCMQEAGEEALALGQTMPATALFPEEVRALLSPEAPRPARRAVEITRLVRHPDFATDMCLVFALFRMAGCLILQFDADIVLSCVRQNHIPFYQRLQFETLAPPRDYPQLKFSTALLACFRESYDRVRRALPLLDCGEVYRPMMLRMMEGGKTPVFGLWRP